MIQQECFISLTLKSSNLEHWSKERAIKSLEIDRKGGKKQYRFIKGKLHQMSESLSHRRQKIIKKQNKQQQKPNTTGLI